MSCGDVLVPKFWNKLACLQLENIILICQNFKSMIVVSGTIRWRWKFPKIMAAIFHYFCKHNLTSN